ncbi:MAG: TraB/GumN family protein [Candidatus Aenigmarchaeota archaeon]|nr:TraB/GumN family protein [Candidatus Aenigmarchaeota archaeon]
MIMQKNVERIKLKDRQIILIGTAHVSKESTKLVNEIIDKETPDTVGVELCKKRYDTIRKKKKWEDTKITKIIKEGKTQLFLANLLLSSFQKRIGEDLKVKPGDEMIQAIKAGKKSSAKIVLLDRDIQVTLKRAWREMSITEKFKLMYSLMAGLIQPEEIEEEMIEQLKEKDVVTQMMEELGREIPSAKKVLIDERDIYIANKIRTSPGKKIVAVVGAGHIEGIKKHLKKKENIEPLEKIPQGSRWVKHIAYAIPLAFLGIIAWGFIHHKSVELTLTMLTYWFLINGILSALGAILALGHPLTILSAFIAAPFTSLNPTIGAGIVAGLVEAKIREPRVKDFQSLGEITTFTGFYKNRVSRILLVAALANLGSSIGTFVALPYLMSLL